MSDFKVSVEQVSLFPHPNADTLVLVGAGGRQYVAKIGQFEEGEVILAIPEKAVLPTQMVEELTGGEKIVRPRVIRGELSEGILVKITDQFSRLDGPFEIGENIANVLGIEEYISPIPVELAGKVGYSSLVLERHDCSQLQVSRAFSPGEPIIVTEKLHGTQLVFNYHRGVSEVSSKGLYIKGLCFTEENVCTRCAKAHNLGHLAQQLGRENATVQIFGNLS